MTCLDISRKKIRGDFGEKVKSRSANLGPISDSLRRNGVPISNNHPSACSPDLERRVYTYADSTQSIQSVFKPDGSETSEMLSERPVRIKCERCDIIRSITDFEMADPTTANRREDITADTKDLAFVANAPERNAKPGASNSAGIS